MFKAPKTSNWAKWAENWNGWKNDFSILGWT